MKQQFAESELNYFDVLYNEEIVLEVFSREEDTFCATKVLHLCSDIEIKYIANTNIIWDNS